MFVEETKVWMILICQEVGKTHIHIVGIDVVRMFGILPRQSP